MSALKSGVQKPLGESRRVESPRGPATIPALFQNHMRRLGKWWIWAGPVERTGYDKVYLGENVFRVDGVIPDGVFVLHACDNRLCVNPAHLFLGTRKDNMMDAAKKGRMRRGEQDHNRKLTEDDVRAIRNASSACSNREIAKTLRVDESTVRAIVNGRAWRHVK